MGKYFGSSMKRTEALETPEEYTWNTGILPPIIPSVSYEKRIIRILVVDNDELSNANDADTASRILYV